MRRFQRVSTSSSGFSLVEILIVAAIVSVVLAAIMALSSITLKSQGQSNLTFQADNIRRNIVSTLNNPLAWKATVMDAGNVLANGPGLDCIQTYPPGTTQPGHVCTTDGATDLPSGVPMTAQPIKFVDDALGAPIYDGSSPASGLTMQGDRCNGFVTPPAPGNDSCPLRFTVLWWAKCSATSCVNPQVQLQVLAVYNPGGQLKFAFNSSNYSTQVFTQGSDPNGGGCWTNSNGFLVDTCSGNVGIGTSCPISALHIVNDATGNTNKDDIRITTYYNGNSAGFLMDRARGSSGAPGSILAGDPVAAIYFSGHDGAVFRGAANIRVRAETDFFTAPKAYMNFETSGSVAGPTEKMRITSDGNVGIGTAAPHSLLHLYGGYLQIPSISASPPPPADCFGVSDEGRMVIYTFDASTHYICFCPQLLGGAPPHKWHCAQSNAIF